MAIFEKFNEAWESRNIDKLAEFFHPDWEFQFHSTGKVIKLEEWKEFFLSLIHI